MQGKEIYRQKNGQDHVFGEGGFKEKSKERIIARLRAKKGFRVVLSDTRGKDSRHLEEWAGCGI